MRVEPRFISVTSYRISPCIPVVLSQYRRHTRSRVGLKSGLTPALFVMPVRLDLYETGVSPFKVIAELITPMIEDMGFELVQIKMIGGSRKTLQIMVEPNDVARSMTLDNCAALSHAVSAILDVEDPIDGAYALEVSSPGIDRPLVRAEDYERFTGHLAKVELEQPIRHGALEQRKFQGKVIGRAGEFAELDVDGQTVQLPIANIRKAKLVLTDELIKSHQRTVEVQAEGDAAVVANGGA